MAAISTAPTAGAAAPGGGAGDIGIIVPPPAKKLVVDRTAAFVAQKGRHVEEEILNRPQAQNAASFTFLLEEDPFHAYYLSKIHEFQSGTTAPAPSQPQQQQQPEPPAAPAPVASSAATNSAPALSNRLTTAMKLALNSTEAALPAYAFSLERPRGLSRHQLALVDLTARFAATDGKKFESDLHYHLKSPSASSSSSSSVNKDDFHFLLPQSPAFQYYADLVRCYKAIADHSAAAADASSLLAWFTQLAEDGAQPLLNRAVLRYEAKRQQELARQREDADEDAKALDRQQFLEVDWHDFVVVETIWFDDDNKEDAAAAAAPLQQQQHTNTVQELVDGMEVRSDYEVAPVRLARARQPMMVALDGGLVPVDQLNAHRRTELLDPKWRENQDKFDKRQRDTNLVGSGSMFAHLAKMAEARPDVFGGEAEEAQAREEEKRRRESERIVWDGNLLTADTVKAAVVASAAAGGSVRPLQAPPAPPPSAPLPPQQPPPRAAAPPPPPSQPEEKRVRLTEEDTTTTQEEAGGVEVSVPQQGAPPGLGAAALSGKLALPRSSFFRTGSVQDLKELIAKQLGGNVPVGKFQLKVASDGRFLKNTDLVSALSEEDAARLEIKWKSR